MSSKLGSLSLNKVGLLSRNFSADWKRSHENISRYTRSDGSVDNLFCS